MSLDRSLLSSCLKENSNFHEWIWGWIWLGISCFHEVVAGIARVADGAGATPVGGAEASMAATTAYVSITEVVVQKSSSPQVAESLAGGEMISHGELIPRSCEESNR